MREFLEHPPQPHNGEISMDEKIDLVVRVLRIMPYDKTLERPKLGGIYRREYSVDKGMLTIHSPVPHYDESDGDTYDNAVRVTLRNEEWNDDVIVMHAHKYVIRIADHVAYYTEETHFYDADTRERIDIHPERNIDSILDSMRFARNLYDTTFTKDRLDEVHQLLDEIEESEAA